MRKILFFLLLCLPFYSKAQIKNDSLHLQLDHIFVMVKADESVLEKMQQAGLTIAEKWKTPHKGQGTTGHFCFFLNFYVEVLEVTNINEARQNTVAFGHYYEPRRSWKKNGSCPFGFGLKQGLPTLDTLQIPFPTQKYQAAWTGKESLRMATTNTDTKEPIVFVEPPSFANQEFEKVEDLDKVARYNVEAKKYRLNALNIKKLTSLKLTLPKNTQDLSPTLQQLQKLQNLQIITGKKTLLELFFDEAKQGGMINLSKELNLIIYY
jgi:hypothetical protein